MVVERKVGFCSEFMKGRGNLSTVLLPVNRRHLDPPRGVLLGSAPPIEEGNQQMNSILKYLLIGTALLALSLAGACKDDASPAAQEATEGAESAAVAGATEGVQAGMEGGAKEGAKEGGKAAAADAVK